MKVALDLPKEVLTAIASDLTTLINETEATLTMLRQNMDAVEAALSPVRRTSITSESNPFRSYIVTSTAVEGFAPGARTYECSCPSFQYERGLDDRSRCKHIRKAQAEGL